MSVRPAKTQISLGIRPVWSVFAARMKKAWVLSYPLSAQRRRWSDWADAQADLSLRWAHSHFVGFVMSRLKYGKDSGWKESIFKRQMMQFEAMYCVSILFSSSGLFSSFWTLSDTCYSIVIHVCKTAMNHVVRNMVMINEWYKRSTVFKSVMSLVQS